MAAKKSKDYCRIASGVQMVDTSFQATDSFVDHMKDVGVSIVARYYDYENETLPGKRLREYEIPIISKAGMSILVVFQHNNNKSETFEDWKNRGLNDAERALKMATELRQPSGSAIYFGVDGDFVGSIPGIKFYTKEVVGYFSEINKVFEADGGKYRIGAYGSGEALRVLKTSDLITLRWLSHSHGFVGSKDALAADRYEIEQYLPGQCGGRSVDFNSLRDGVSDVGQFKLI
ncbi:glycoside hydrolase domain-containing protein [Paracoccus sp. SCSIO 75233]|uniref:glycoside hydrolase domain-containing protein n=1 Tax=Paracoccus sp. SCSIO 75233 TaxID=3017782 RepID=UPI0022F108E3|nr:glycoside hydrolase domain-containing protein [Paracoccus sp. SCSIO 75233]WBU51769.1 DUF1906 domain-containing protein [Paracoccus sp. SCSIO 75233]